MADVAVVIPVFGNRSVWDLLACRAADSAENQTVKPEIIRQYASNLATARNYGAQHAQADWLIFLDADDELDSYYVEEMLRGKGDIRQPSTLGVYPDGGEDDFPVLIPPHPDGFMVGNHLVIGCMVRKSFFERVGGFRDLPCLEDWDLWIRCRLLGAQVGTCPKAVYRVHVRSKSRNNDVGLHSRTYTEIQHQYQSDWRKLGLQ